MNYSLEDIKKLFDQFNLQKADDGIYIAAKIGTNIFYDDPEFVEKVKFAHTWFAATRFERPLESPDGKQITENDYKYAFGPQAKEVYDNIMAQVSNTMQAAGVLMREETLEKEIVAAINYKYASSIVKGLYSKEHFKASLENWVRMANNFPIKENPSIQR